MCGLHILSAIPFPELPSTADSPAGVPPDVEFEMKDGYPRENPGVVVMTSEEDDGSPWLRCTRTDAGYHLHFSELADFVVDRSGRQISCVAPRKTPPETIRHLFLDHVIPPLLNLRGREALHASAIETATGACAFIGASGQGKSTLASAFHVIGYPILCDDCLVLKDDPDAILVQPAYPGLRLWDDSRGALFGSRRTTLPVSHYNDKRRISALDAGSQNKEFLPLRRIYSLRRNDEGDSVKHPAIEALSVRDALVELISYTFRLDLSDQAMILRQMNVLERVAKRVPVKRLRLPNRLDALAAVRNLILQDLGRN